LDTEVGADGCLVGDDTAPYIEWLAMVCALVAVLFSNDVLT